MIKLKIKFVMKKLKALQLDFKILKDLPPKELRKLVDKGKKELGEGIVVVFTYKDEKVGVAVGYF